jgi:mono/diheme cytochrome c family protein
MKPWRAAGALLLAAVAGVGLRLGAELVNWGGADAQQTQAAFSESVTPALIARGAYLSKVGNCAGCHTVRGGHAYAGGLGLQTPFGAVYAGNLTPHETGLKGWSAQDFWQAMHHGRSKDGRLLYPAFPYTNFTQVTPQDVHALWAYFQFAVRPVERTNSAHEVAFPFNSQLAMAAWRALYFSPEPYKADPKLQPAQQRGAYWVSGLGHCNACHAQRNSKTWLVASCPCKTGMHLRFWHPAKRVCKPGQPPKWCSCSKPACPTKAPQSGPWRRS